MKDKGTPIGTRNGIKIYARLKSTKPINRTSKLKDRQIRDERQLKKMLLIRCKGLCEECGKPPMDGIPLAKHEIIFRSHGGDCLDPDNTLMLCNICHDERHHIHHKENQHGK